MCHNATHLQHSYLYVTTNELDVPKDLKKEIQFPRIHTIWFISTQNHKQTFLLETFL